MAKTKVKSLEEAHELGKTQSGPQAFVPAPPPHPTNSNMADRQASFDPSIRHCRPSLLPLDFTGHYCSSFSTSCCTLLAWASAEMPVWLRISNFDRFEVAVP
jgi:hypothetical protein